MLLLSLFVIYGCWILPFGARILWLPQDEQEMWMCKRSVDKCLLQILLPGLGTISLKFPCFTERNTENFQSVMLFCAVKELMAASESSFGRNPSDPSIVESGSLFLESYEILKIQIFHISGQLFAKFEHNEMIFRFFSFVYT
ncbi:hypothetical protein Nepgr_006332 [Nepenthes gracilis]|uniref:Uncharacterized protein n=1 Tax=Nepenthes gracilis TaxID=150966 RepID=A0AAD3S4U0_NEPGR|nr:hypothetical protein Nepgr_006332 [Nepenthes gracilis]